MLSEFSKRYFQNHDLSFSEFSKTQGDKLIHKRIGPIMLLYIYILAIFFCSPRHLTFLVFNRALHVAHEFFCII